MKKGLIYSLFVTLILTSVSCSNDFLDPVRNTETLTDEDFANNVAVNPALVEGSLTGIYTYMATPGAALGTSYHYDFGQKSLDIWSDMLSGDMALTANAYGWYANFTNLVSTSDYTRSENAIAWNYLYKVVSLSNSVINSMGGNNANPQGAQAKAVYGQAKALRGYAYFYLTQLFQKGYDPSQPILPLYDGTPGSGVGKAPASDVYNLIVSDLTQAVGLLDGFERADKSQINKSVAQGLLAYTYAAMGNYQQAKTLSDNIIATGGFPLTTTAQLAFPGTGSGFNDVTTPSWMWGYDITSSLGYGLVSWWGQMDLYTYSYAWAGDKKAMDNLLYATMPANDVRKTQFSTSATYLYMPTKKFFGPARTIGGQRPIVSDYIYMRVEEFYLLSAESSAKLGNEADAKSTLKLLLANRLGGAANASAYVDPLTGNALKNAIYLQTKIELWGEGKSYLAMKRNRATITRGTNHVYLSGASIPYNDDRLTFKIPQSEMNNNPSITGQN